MHRKTLHYIFGYLIATVMLVVSAAIAPQSQAQILMLGCATIGAWVHSIMDLGDHEARRVGEWLCVRTTRPHTQIQPKDDERPVQI